MTGSDLTTPGVVQEKTPEAEVLLEARGVVKSYKGGWRRKPNRVLFDANIALNPGEIVGLVGENGSGKTTFMKIMVGSIDRDAGEIRRTESIGYCPQDPLLYERLTCDEHFELFGKAYGFHLAQTEKSRDSIYDVLGFVEYRDTRVEELSGGTRAKLNLGLALLPDPEILLLDEPYSGFDWETYLRFWQLAGERRDAGRSVLIISHFVVDEERFDRIVHLRDGVTTS